MCLTCITAYDVYVSVWCMQETALPDSSFSVSMTAGVCTAFVPQGEVRALTLVVVVVEEREEGEKGEGEENDTLPQCRIQG